MQRYDARSAQSQEKNSRLSQRVEPSPLPSQGGISQLQSGIGNKAIGQLMKASRSAKSAPLQRKAKDNGLPAPLKSGIESLSGISMDDVNVHYNSPKPDQLNAAAYAHGTDIHLGAGQEQHLPHEAWHIVQQAQGRVRPTAQLKEMAVNEDPQLEREADVMGSRIAQASSSSVTQMKGKTEVSGSKLDQLKEMIEENN
ncbi:DUF4157 domain-containing protein [Paenibacillus sp. 1P07SE]|uniref:eCIS core domain-containing protein n=1 Tax=Paenibacillus sp. 1P07SE TaxID=3132209 RepID=UPI0039A5C834